MANTDWQKVLGWNKEQVDEFRIAGFLYLRQGIYDKAELFFEALVLLNTGNVYDFQTLGALYLQMNKHEKALNTLNKALELEPAYEPSLLNKTKALLLLGRKEEAFTIARKLEKSMDPFIANDASALILAYR